MKRFEKTILSTAQISGTLALFAASPAMSATLAQYDLLDPTNASNLVSQVDPTNASATSYTANAGGFSDFTDSQFGDLATQDPLASFTVTADSGFLLNLNSFIFNYAVDRLDTDEFITFNVLVNGSNVYSDTVQGIGTVVGDVVALSSGTIDLTGAPFQGLSSALVEITTTDPVGAPSDGTVRIFGTGTTITLYNPSGGRTDLTLTGDVVAIPEPSSAALIGLALGGFAFLRRR